MKRLYKEDTPINTIIKIRNLLGEIGVINYESFWGKPYDDIFSVRIDSLETEGNFGTNGKGSNRLYALASGYAEYIERLQNGVLAGPRSMNRFFCDKIKEETGYYFFPDEKFLNKKEFKALPYEYLRDVFGRKDNKTINKEIDNFFIRLKSNGFPGVLSVPFYDVEKKGITYLPHNINIMITGSNGMSAGNSIAEGIFQGICELIERYAVSIVFYEKLTPPTVMEEYFSLYPKEMKIINDIKANGYDLIVKDFSCNKNLPAVGVIIIDKEKQMYRLNVGSDTSFQVALSRALTEIHQGKANKKAFDETLLPIPENLLDYFSKTDNISQLKCVKEFRKYIFNGSGVFPKTLFNDNESYSINLDAFQPKENYIQEVKYLINLVQKNVKNIFIRDVSFLGFPSFYIYIPEISPIGIKTSENDWENVNLSQNVNNDLIEDLFFPFNKLITNNEKLQKFVNIIIPSSNISEIRGERMSQILKLEFKSNFYWESIQLSFFLALFYCILSDFSNAIEALKIFMDETGNNEDPYYNCVLKYFKLKGNNIPQDIINESIPDEIINDFNSPQKLFSNIHIPNCPNCSNCDISDSCLTKHKVNFSKRILSKMAESKINQGSLSIFC